jgi:outer membrane immunogenic protein
MKSIGLLSAVNLSLCTALPIQAADLPPRTPISPPRVPAQTDVATWTGFYVGIHSGGAWGSSSWSDPFSGLTDTVSSSGFLAGGQIGYNYQIGKFVVGIDGDASWLNLNGNNTDSAGNDHNSKVDWTATITARVGLAIDRWLVYTKGGVAFASDSSTVTDPFANTANGATTHVGWTVGTGFEYAFASNWYVRIEYDYLSFGARDVELNGTVLGTGTGNVDLSMHQVKGGLNYRF